jgi:hypothetical protein
MNTIAIVFTVVYLGLAIWLLIRLPMALSKNIKTGIQFRKALLKQVADLRLGKMLSRLGINRDRYLMEQRTHLIKYHINRCESCENTDTCDGRLEDEGEVADDVATYCPNAEDLLAIRNEPGINKTA